MAVNWGVVEPAILGEVLLWKFHVQEYDADGDLVDDDITGRSFAFYAYDETDPSSAIRRRPASQSLTCRDRSRGGDGRQGGNAAVVGPDGDPALALDERQGPRLRRAAGPLFGSIQRGP